jgi:hypothetical protein
VRPKSATLTSARTLSVCPSGLGVSFTR